MIDDTSYFSAAHLLMEIGYAELKVRCCRYKSANQLNPWFYYFKVEGMTPDGKVLMDE